MTFTKLILVRTNSSQAKEGKCNGRRKNRLDYSYYHRGLAGCAAQYLMKNQTGVFLNIILGIIGAALASFLFGLLGISFAGWVGYLISGFVGACILIWLGRKVRS